MDEDYVSFETAKLLKEKGLLVSLINIEDWIFSMYDTEGRIRYGCFSTDWYPRITIQMACKWLREVYNIHIYVEPDTAWFGTAMIGEERLVYNPHIIEWKTTPSNSIAFPAERFCKYEQACEAAIKYSLENLIIDN